MRLLFSWFIICWIILAIGVFISLFFFSAPYGRYHRSGWGYSIENSLGWIIMEAPAPCLFLLCFLLGKNGFTVTSLVFLLMWEAHYAHRAFIYPFSLRGGGKRMPVVVVVMGIIFNTVNTYLNGYYLFFIADDYTIKWVSDPRFLAGFLLFIAGYILNRQADWKLRELRAEGESGYKIPANGIFRLVSCPNYLGEIVIWLGWALATWSLPGLAFAVWTLANLVPRAWKHHTWYQQTFSDYPSNRKALIPWLW